MKRAVMRTVVRTVVKTVVRTIVRTVVRRPPERRLWRRAATEMGWRMRVRVMRTVPRGVGEGVVAVREVSMAMVPVAVVREPVRELGPLPMFRVLPVRRPVMRSMVGMASLEDLLVLGNLAVKSDSRTGELIEDGLEEAPETVAVLLLFAPPKCLGQVHLPHVDRLLQLEYLVAQELEFRQLPL